jgi:L-amino acid N-acyltransferase YncA
MQLSFKIISAPGPADQDIRAFIAENDNDFYPPIAARRSLTEFVQSVYEHNGKYVVCFFDGRIIGLTSIYLTHPAFITYYHYVAIDKAFRHKGIGTALYNYVHDICRENGVQRAIVKTWSTNQTSQAMFKKHGFFHLDTIEDDRSPGIHTYFFTKYFYDIFLQRPLMRLAITGSIDNYSMGRFAKTMSSIPKTTYNGQSPIPFTVVSDPFEPFLTGYKGPDSKIASTERFNDLLQSLEQNGVSHLLFLDGYNYPFVDYQRIKTNIEILDLAALTKKLVNARDKKCLLIASDISASIEFFDVANIQIPGQTDSKRINAIIDEIKAGKVAPAYYKHEIATIALLNDCNAVLLGSAELHTMFGFDKIYNEIEVFDPWIEIALAIQSSRMKFEDQLIAAASDKL